MSPLRAIEMLTVGQLFFQMKEWGAGYHAQIFRDADGVPIRAVILVEGAPEAGEIADACERISESWHEDDGA